MFDKMSSKMILSLITEIAQEVVDESVLLKSRLSCHKNPLIDETSLAKLKDDVPYFKNGTFTYNKRDPFFYFEQMPNNCGLSPSAKCIKYEMMNRLYDYIYELLIPNMSYEYHQAETEAEMQKYEDWYLNCDLYDDQDFMDLFPRVYLLLRKANDSTEYNRFEQYQEPIIIKDITDFQVIYDDITDELISEIIQEAIDEEPRVISAKKIQEAWRLCRYNPAYKMCETVLIHNIERDTGMTIE